MVSFKHQIAFAAHILTLMATFFGLGYWLAQYVTDSTAVVRVLPSPFFPRVAIVSFCCTLLVSVLCTLPVYIS